MWHYCVSLELRNTVRKRACDVSGVKFSGEFDWIPLSHTCCLGHIGDAFVYKLKIFHSNGECHNKVGVKRVILVAYNGSVVLWL